jgi:xanthine dehydrogenase accessory factor
MICGGNVTVHYQYIDPEDQKARALFTDIAGSFDRNENVWIVRRIQNSVLTGMGIRDGNGLRYLDNAPEEALKPLFTGNSEVLSGDPAYYVEPLIRAGRVYIFGGGHVAQELVPVLSHVGFSVVVFEDREAFSDKKLFSGVTDTVLGRFDQIDASVIIHPEDYVVIMTRGHQADFDVLRQVLRTRAAYIGCIGSRKKVEATQKRLVEDGIPREELVRVHSPIGLEILAETPAEIAISIAAQLIRHRAELCRASAQ